MQRHRESIFKAALLVGFLLGLLLLTRTVITYRYVTGELLMDHFGRIATVHLAELQIDLRENQPDDLTAFQALLDSFLTAHQPEIAGIRIISEQDSLVVTAGGPDLPSLEGEDVQALIGPTDPYVVNRLQWRGRSHVRVLVPFRFRPGFLRAQRPGPGDMPGSGLRVAPDRTEEASPDSFRRFDRIPARFQPGQGAAPRTPVGEVFLSLSEAADSYLPLRRNLIIGITAAAALLLAMVIAALRLRAYLRGQELAQQVALAEGVQQRLLPVRLASIPGLEIADAFTPAYGVAGDYYDVFTLEDGRVVMILGDVSGKGISAALIMSLLHGAVRTVADGNGVGLAAQVSRVNDLLVRQTASDNFVTLFWAVFDPGTRKLEYVNCGHSPPVIRRIGSGGDRLHELTVGGLVAGMKTGVPYEVGTEILQLGEVLVMYSDGLDEAENRFGEMYGRDRLYAFLEDTAQGASASEIRDGLLGDVKDFRGNAPASDDLTLLIVLTC